MIHLILPANLKNLCNMYVDAEIRFDDNLMSVIIAVGEGYNEKYDEHIFFYADSEEDLEAMKEKGVEDFQIVSLGDRYETLEEIFG